MNVEGLIIGLIVMAVAALFNQKKAPNETGESTNSPQTTGQRSMKRAEDYAKEIYGDLQTQMKQHPEKTKEITRKVQEKVDRSPVAKKVQEIADNSAFSDASREISAQEPIGRIGSVTSRMGSERKTSAVAKGFFPIEKDDLQKSIILAEIFMPPKSKR